MDARPNQLFDQRQEWHLSTIASVKERRQLDLPVDLQWTED